MTAEEIRALRRKLGLTMMALARRLEVDITTVYRWESGRTKPSRLALLRLRQLDEEAERGKNG